MGSVILESSRSALCCLHLHQSSNTFHERSSDTGIWERHQFANMQLASTATSSYSNEQPHLIELTSYVCHRQYATGTNKLQINVKDNWTLKNKKKSRESYKQLPKSKYMYQTWKDVVVGRGREDKGIKRCLSNTFRKIIGHSAKCTNMTLVLAGIYVTTHQYLRSISQQTKTFFSTDYLNQTLCIACLITSTLVPQNMICLTIINDIHKSHTDMHWHLWKKSSHSVATQHSTKDE